MKEANGATQLNCQSL